jgi:two-component system sensor histidine kinase RegB
MADVRSLERPTTNVSRGSISRAKNPAQDDAWSWTAPGLRRGRLRVRTLLAQRWLTVVGQTAALLIAGLA